MPIDNQRRNEFINRVWETAFNGEQTRERLPSLYQVGGRQVEIHVTEPNFKGTLFNKYYFGITHLDEVESVVLVCVNDYYAFIIPSNRINEWGIYNYEGKGYRTTITIIGNNCYINRRKQDGLETRININEYRVNIKRNGETRLFDRKIVYIALATQRMLGLG